MISVSLFKSRPISVSSCRFMMDDSLFKDIDWQAFILLVRYPFIRFIFLIVIGRDVLNGLRCEGL